MMRLRAVLVSVGPFSVDTQGGRWDGGAAGHERLWRRCVHFSSPSPAAAYNTLYNTQTKKSLPFPASPNHASQADAYCQIFFRCLKGRRERKEERAHDRKKKQTKKYKEKKQQAKARQEKKGNAGS
jgi:hypothetical protein